MNKDELIEMLTALRDQAQAVKYDAKSAVLLTDTKLSSYAWIITDTINFLKEVDVNE